MRWCLYPMPRKKNFLRFRVVCQSSSWLDPCAHAVLLWVCECCSLAYHTLMVTYWAVWLRKMKCCYVRYGHSLGKWTKGGANSQQDGIFLCHVFFRDMQHISARLPRPTQQDFDAPIHELSHTGRYTTKDIKHCEFWPEISNGNEAVLTYGSKPLCRTLLQWLVSIY